MAKKQTEQLTSTATEYLKANKFAEGKQHEWIYSEIKKILNGRNPTDDEIIDFVYSDTDEKPIPQNISVPMSYAVEPLKATKIKRVDYVQNIGLLDIDKDVEFSPGLTVIYGQNGAGKSSLYGALCVTSGINTTILPNLADAEKLPKCLVTFLDKNHKELPVEWNANLESNPVNLGVKLFDADIAQKLVSTDQENKFELSHLKLEFFGYVHDFIDKTDQRLNERIATVKENGSDLKQVFLEQYEDFGDQNLTALKEKSKSTFTKEDAKSLETIKEKIKGCNKASLSAKKDQLTRLIASLDGFLRVFYVSTGDAPKLVYDDAFFSYVKQTLEQYKTKTDEFEQIKNGNLDTLIPEVWRNDPLWSNFIQSGIEFTNHLQTADHKRYTEDNCPYCHQELTGGSKKLVLAYDALYSKYNQAISEIENELKNINRKLNAAIEALQLLSAKEDNFYETITSVVSRPVIKNTLDLFATIKGCVISKKLLDFDDSNTEYVAHFASAHDILLGIHRSELAETKKLEEEIEPTFNLLNKECKELESKKFFSDHKESILKYINLAEQVIELENKRKSLVSLKQQRSTMQSDFAQLASMTEFRKYLDDEYDFLNFTPPEYFKISTATRGDKNNRVFSLRDKRLSEIFSEGEIKLHALADFLAENTLNKYKGVYLFDDPVTSLDQQNIEIVTERLINLVADGNQVVVFTHNIFFANELEDVAHVTATEFGLITVNKYKNGSSVNRIKSGKMEDIKGLQSAYKELNEHWQEIQSLENVPTRKINEAYNLISRYLEYYLEQKMLLNILNRHRAHMRMNNLPNLTIDDETKLAVSTIYRRTSRKGNRHSQPLEVTDATMAQLEADMTKITSTLTP